MVNWLKRLIDDGRVVAPGCPDPLTALAAAHAGFGALLVGGAPLALRQAGLADPALLGAETLAATVRAIAAVTRTPLIADAGIAPADPAHAAHLVRNLAASGAAAILVRATPAATRAASAAAHESGALLIARWQPATPEAAVLDAKAHAAAGADLLCPDCTSDTLARTAKALVSLRPVVAFARDDSAALAADELFTMGFAVALFPYAALRAQAAATEALFAWLATQRTLGSADWLAPLPDITSLAGLPALERARAIHGETP